MAGVVEAIGPAVRTGLQVGDEVFGYVRRDDLGYGTAAELVPAPERAITAMPAGLSFEQAAALPLVGLTAYQALTEALRVRDGERVLVHAASGGVGRVAVLDLIGGSALEDAPVQVKDVSRVASVIDADTVQRIGGRYVFVRPDRAGLDALGRLVTEGALQVNVAETFDLERIADAHRLSETGHARGKVVVRI